MNIKIVDKETRKRLTNEEIHKRAEEKVDNGTFDEWECCIRYSYDPKLEDDERWSYVLERTDLISDGVDATPVSFEEIDIEAVVDDGDGIIGTLKGKGFLESDILKEVESFQFPSEELQIVIKEIASSHMDEVWAYLEKQAAKHDIPLFTFIGLNFTRDITQETFDEVLTTEVLELIAKQYRDGLN